MQIETKRIELLLQYSDYIIPAFMLLLFLLLIFLSLTIRYKFIEKKIKKILLKREEKIKFLRQINAENESHKLTYEHQTEKEILLLKHTIEKLEQQAKEGTKNQVVAKIEAQQSKRTKLMRRAGLIE